MTCQPSSLVSAAITPPQFTWSTLAILLATFVFPAAAADMIDRRSLPIKAPAHTGELALTVDASEQQFPQTVRAPEGAPNVIVVMTDDVAFGAIGTFGGAVPTPELDEIAAQGVRFSRFHTVGVCSPTRAALLTGRNHHRVGMGSLVELNSPYPGYTGRIPESAATMARVLRDNGYNTAMFGKDHNVPMIDRAGAGPFDQWPTGRLRGFDYFWGFVAGDTNQWKPGLTEGTVPLDTSDWPEDRLFDEAMADRAIQWIHQVKAVAPDEPFFMYYAPGTAHAPLQAPQEWIDRYAGQFDEGWDALRDRILAQQIAAGVIPEGTVGTPRPDMIRAWSSLSDSERRVYARFMEVYAAMLAYQDFQFGRIMDELHRMGIAENTLVIYIQGDNGASGEAGVPGTLNEMPWLSHGREYEVGIEYLANNLDVIGSQATYPGYQLGWTWATSSPFQWFKQLPSHFGGTRNSMVMSWPARFQGDSSVRSQFHHVIDVMPTVLEAAGIAPPERVDGVEQLPLDGVSMLYAAASAEAAGQRNTQYFELYGNRGIYHDGWFAGTTPRNYPWELTTQRENSDVTTYPWELYHVDSDFSQANDLASERPDKLAAMQQLFDQEARDNWVYPIHDSGAPNRGMVMAQGGGGPGFRTDYVVWGPNVSLGMYAAPYFYSLPFTLTADITVPEAGANGVLVAAGSYFGGWSFYLHDNKPVAMASVSPLPGGQTRLSGDQAIAPGEHTVTYNFTPQGLGGHLRIAVDGQVVAEGDVAERPLSIAGNGEKWDTGRDLYTPVSTDYADGGYFTGTLHKVTVKLQPPSRPSH